MVFPLFIPRSGRNELPPYRSSGGQVDSVWKVFGYVLMTALYVVSIVALGVCGIVFADTALHPAWVTPSPWWLLLDALAVLVFCFGVAWLLVLLDPT